jgi:glucose-1-phosphatase
MSEPISRPDFFYFDLGNVLCFFDHDLSARQMAEVCHSDPKTLRRIVYESDLEHRFESGLVSPDGFAEEIMAAVGRRVSTAALLEAASRMFQPNQAMLPILEKLKTTKLRMGILSNTNIAHWEWILAQRYPVLKDWFELNVLSFEVGCMKPESTIYRIATEQAKVPAERIFFIDDRADNIAGAKAYGWQTLTFTNVGELQTIIDCW